MNFQELTRISSGFAEARILQVSVKLGIFDAIKEEGSSSEEIARVIRTDPRATELLLNALVALKILEKKEKKFFNTEVSIKYLVKASPRYLGYMILFEESLWGTWEKLEDSIRTGQPARPADMFQSREEETQRFIMAMHSLVRARGDAEKMCEVIDFGSIKSLIDIGSGPGTYPIEFIKKHPHLKITILDLPNTLKITRKILKEEGVLDSIEIIEGDYNRDPIPSGFDMAFLSNIIHSEDEETNRQLIKKIYDSLNNNGQIVIKDHILDDTLTNPPVGAIFSILMLLVTRGRAYSFGEVKNWLEEAGFKGIEWKKLEPPLTSSLVIGYK